MTCKTCKFREASDSTCHRNPPQITMYPTDNQQPIMYAVTQCWPEVKDTDWCGEHQPKKDTKVLPHGADIKTNRRGDNKLCTAQAPCCARRGEYNGFGSDGPLKFNCDVPTGCSCHD